MLIDEKTKLLALDRKVNEFAKEWYRSVPFGKAGSDGEFSLLCEDFEDFYNGWKLWLSNHTESMKGNMNEG